MKNALCVALLCVGIHASFGAVVKFDWIIEDWVTDFMRQTATEGRKTPFHIKEENLKAAVLINGQYPGPAIEVFENDEVEITVRNNLLSAATSIHWHGIHPRKQPWADGAAWVTQAPIGPGQNYTYKFTAWPAGTHYYHSHMDAMQSAKGLKGAFIVRPREDPLKHLYDEEKIIQISDEWRDPEVCLKLEGAMPGNDVCSDLEYASFNGIYGDGTKEYPFPTVEVEAGKCYRLRFIMFASNTENFQMKISGHNMTMVATDGYPVKPIQVSGINMHIGERYDVIVCADQDPGYYQMSAVYDYGCTLTPGHFIPPGFHPVRKCDFYAFLKYEDKGLFPPARPTTPEGTGGGKNPKAVAGEVFDLTNAAAWKMTEPVEPVEEPEEPDVRYIVNLGLHGPVYKKADTRPLSMGRWYMDLADRRESWNRPKSPILQTKGKCGADNVPIVDIPENATTVEIIINNVSPTAHIVHMHGMPFTVTNVADFQWCNVNKTACFLMPEFLNPCPAEDRQYGDPDHKFDVEAGLYWGCAFNEKNDRPKQNLKTALKKDTFQVWQRSWAVIRFKATVPGLWLFHCHMEQHVPLGMVMALNVLPSQQPPIPEDSPTEGPCPVWSWDAEKMYQDPHHPARLQSKVNQLEQELAEAKAVCPHLQGKDALLNLLQ